MRRGWDGVKWVEVWIDTASPADYVLVLRELVDGSLEVVDPQEKGKIVRVFANYEEAKDWLREDEYDIAAGRWGIDAE
jgi:hypothetical protein